MDTATLLEEQAIRQLVARYADAVGRRDAKAWGETWTDDGVWELMGQRKEGREQVVKLWSAIMSGFEMVVQIPGSALIEVDGDRATGRWYMIEYIAGPAMLNMGHYLDRYQKVRGEWRFAHRRFDVLYSGPPDLSGKPTPFPEDLKLEGPK